MPFSDTQNHWARECIEQLYDRKIISGYPDGTFRPNESVTRAEFAAILNKAFPNAALIRNGIIFTDVPAKLWAYSAIQRVYRAGFISGYPDRSFKPSQPIPRVQALVALVSGLKYSVAKPEVTPETPLKAYYDDAEKIPSYAVGAIAAATQKRLVVNYPNIKLLNPNFSATRADIAAFITQALNLPGVPLQYVPGLDIIAISPQFEAADSFKEGLARVKVNQKWGYIDPKGKVIIQPQLDEAESFSEGLALVRSYQTVRFKSTTGDVAVRGVWLPNTDSRVFSSRQAIAEAMDFLAQTGFNTIFPVVWNNGATLYPSKVMRDNFGLEIDPRFTGRDPLAEMIAEAKRVGLSVIPWFEYGFASSFSNNGGRILAAKPQWAAKDINGNLLKKNNFEWLNSLDPEVQNFLKSLILEVVKNYDIAGIQGDDRFPALPSEGGYDPQTIQRYFQDFNQNPPDNPKDPQWLQWRADILTDFLTQLYQELIEINPNLIISLSPSFYPWALQEYLQDSQAWVDRGLVDLVHPQLYRRELEGYKLLVDQVTQQFKPLQLPSLSPGILMKVSSYRISSDQLIQTLQYNRDRAILGEVFFFYEGLREGNNELGNTLRSRFYSQSSPLNTTKVKEQGFTPRRLGGKYRYIDKLGRSVIQPQFDWVYPYNEGLAIVRLGYKYSYIDKIGKLITRLQFDNATDFSEGLGLIKIGNKYGYIDNTGQLVIPLQFDDADSFSEGFAAVKIGNKWNYFNKNGRIAFNSQFDSASQFKEGRSLVRIAGKFGYIDTTGTIIIQPQFDNAKSFCDGLAPVKVGSKWGYINSRGQVVISPNFLDAEPFSETLAAVNINNKWGYIDKTGQVTILLDFDEAKSFSEGLALVKLSEKWGYIRNPIR